MGLLWSKLWPILFLTGLFVGGVYLVKYIIHRFFNGSQ
jgi:hypothetical protein